MPTHDTINSWMSTARGFYIMISGVLILLVSGVTTWTTMKSDVDTLNLQVDTLKTAVGKIREEMAEDNIQEAVDALNMQNMKTSLDTIDEKIDRLIDKLLDD